MITSIEDYLNYFRSLRKRTHRFVEAVPAEKIDWAPQAGEYTLGDIIRHMGSIQMMNWRHVARDELVYPGHDRVLGAAKTAALAYLEGCHAQATALLKNCEDAVLHQPRPDLNGRPTAAWRFLMATVEHEVHHRSQLATYLQQLDIDPPQLYGVHVESLPVN